MLVAPGEFVFIHLPKTGGVWVRAALEAAGRAPMSRRVTHVPASEVPVEYQGLPMFGFVRDPWDWYCSMFGFCTTTGSAGMAARGWLRLAGETFPEFVRCLATLDENTAQAREVRDWLAGPEPEGFQACGKYVHALKGRGTGIYSWLVDLMFGEGVTVFKFEDGLGRGVAKFLGQEVAELPKLNASIREARKQMFHDRELVDLVAEKEATTIQRFGYRFE